jgi:single-stranded DNA-binding protein
MNNLNSILIEGYMATDPLLCEAAIADPRFHTEADIDSSKRKNMVCTFSLISEHFYQKNACINKEETHIDIQILGELGERCSTLGRKGRNVRVVGHIRQDRLLEIENGKPNGKEKLLPRIYIEAEHIEFRPEFKPQEEKQDANI